MKIQLKDQFGVTETAIIYDVTPAQIERTMIGHIEHFSFGGTVLVSIDHEAQRILYAAVQVTVFHNFEGRVQQFQGLGQLTI